MDFEIIHHGAAQGVTGSCHELRCGESGFLVDCGLFQGADLERRGIVPDIDFPIHHIAALVVTHVHIDHVGRIPHLLAAGFQGPIFCSIPSSHLLIPVLEDAVKIGITADKRLIKKFLARLKAQLVPLEYGVWRELPSQKAVRASVRLKPAGHILGSAYVEFRLQKGDRPENRILFSGDLGAPYAPLIAAPQPAYGADVVVLESTYGDRLHEGRRERQSRLKAVVQKALENRGALLIPAFSIGRTQELLYEIETCVHQCARCEATKGLPWQDLEVVVDSPLASRFTSLYRELKGYWDREAQRRLRFGRHPLSFEQMTTIESHEEHLYTVEYIKKKGSPCIVLAASGMCNGGRIVNYLKALVGDARTDVLFVGYQAAGTPGRAILRYGPQHGYVAFDGKKYTIQAGIHSVSGYSAHADQANLLHFISRMRKRPRQVRVVHGEESARQALAKRLLALGVPEVVGGE